MAEPLGRITTASQPTWQSSSSHSSSSSALRYQLDEDDTSPILVYKWDSDLTTSSQKALCDALDNDPTYRPYRVTTLPIPRFSRAIEVARRDLYMPSERAAYEHLPNYDAPIALVRLPANVLVGRALLGAYDRLFIVSPETSPEGSLGEGSLVEEGEERGESGKVSTWKSGDADADAEVGAGDERGVV